MTDLDHIAERAAEVLDQIASACRDAGRDPSEVRLVAVSKRHPADAVRRAYEAGLRDFGESYAQEMVDKREQLVDLADARWHFVGRVQRNKAKLLAGCALVHGVGSVQHAEAIARRAPGTGVLAQVNASDEEQKNGFSFDGIERELDALLGIEGAPLRGLMAMLEAGDEGARARERFAAVRELRDRLAQRAGRELPELSMGMTADFREAVHEGATLVRVGTAIFGRRNT
jgi:pyridoxal phosphate enzyme (YggS family)